MDLQVDYIHRNTTDKKKRGKDMTFLDSQKLYVH